MLKGTDPATGKPDVYSEGKYAGQLKDPPKKSSSFRSNEAYAQAEARARDSAEFLEKARAGADEIKVKDLPLRDALGDDYLRHVEGRTTTGAPAGSTRATDFNGGSVTAIYRRNSGGGYDLVTMYPEGR